MGGEPPVSLRHRMCSIWLNLPVAKPAVTDRCWQGTELAKSGVNVAVLDMDEPRRTFASHGMSMLLSATPLGSDFFNLQKVFLRPLGRRTAPQICTRLTEFREVGGEISDQDEPDGRHQPLILTKATIRLML